MKKFGYLSAVLLAGILFLGTMACFAQDPTVKPGTELDGYSWTKSTDNEKQTFLYGAGSAIVLEYHVREKHQEEPSRFVQGWVEACADLSWTQLAAKVDDYYAANPDKLQRHVFEVLWHEVIKPRLKG